MATTPQIENATICGTMLSTKDYGLLTAFVGIKGEGWFGGFLHETPPRGAKGPIGHASLATFVRGVLDVLGMETWETLSGVNCRVRWADGKYAGSIAAIGHITKDRWFTPKAMFVALDAATKAKA